METGYRCAHPHARYMVKTPAGLVPSRHTIEERNALNDCADFQPRRVWLTVWRQCGVMLCVVLGLWILLYTFLVWWGHGQ
jgi:hypothetical protein